MSLPLEFVCGWNFSIIIWLCVVLSIFIFLPDLLLVSVYQYHTYPWKSKFMKKIFWKKKVMVLDINSWWHFYLPWVHFTSAYLRTMDDFGIHKADSKKMFSQANQITHLRIDKIYSFSTSHTYTSQIHSGQMYSSRNVSERSFSYLWMEISCSQVTISNIYLEGIF